MSAISKAAYAALKTAGKIAHDDRTLTLKRHDPDGDNGLVTLVEITEAFFVEQKTGGGLVRPYTDIRVAEQPGVTAQELVSLTAIEFDGQRYVVDDPIAPVDEGRVWLFRCSKESRDGVVG